MLPDELALEGWLRYDTPRSGRTQPDENKGSAKGLWCFTWPGHIKTGKDVFIIRRAQARNKVSQICTSEIYIS